MSFAIGLALMVWLLTTVLTLLGTFWTLKHSKTPIRPVHRRNLPPVTILKPLKGIDRGLYENLRSFFELDYPHFELVFSIADGDDPARFVVNRLLMEYPHVQARLEVGEVPVGTNPKVNNMMKGYDSARYDLILISDSNVRVQPDYLTRMTPQVTPNTGVITAVVVGRSPEKLGGWLEATFLNTFLARAMVVAPKFGRPCVVGKSMLFRRSQMERFGGMRALSRFLAEDFMAGEIMRKMGLEVKVMVDPVGQHIDQYTFRTFWQRHVRWGRIRKSQSPTVFLGELFFTSVVSGLLGAWAFNQLFGIDPTLFLALHFCFWLICDLCLLRVFSHEYMPLRQLAAWTIRELLAVPLWLHSALGNKVKWKNRKIRIRPGGIIDADSLEKFPA